MPLGLMIFFALEMSPPQLLPQQEQKVSPGVFQVSSMSYIVVFLEESVLFIPIVEVFSDFKGA